MSTIGVQLTAQGLQLPDYADILQELKIQFWQIYGSDADLDDDSADGQWVAVLAQIIYDTGLVAQAVYQAFSPATAQGVQLSQIVKINGISRNVSSHSTVNVTIGGTANSVIVNGVVGDNQNLNTQWTLPSIVTIGGGGTVDVTATCTQAGAVTAAPGTITKILTPTSGWQTATNAASAAPGLPVETDSQLRTRQSQSTALPAQSVLDSIFASVVALTGVARAAAYENDTDITDANGLPPHSISLVVSGGVITDIANAIALKKTPGTRSFGSTTVTVFDQAGVPNVIGFYVLANVELVFEIDIHALAGFVSTTEAEIQNAVANFVNAYLIGESAYLNRLWIPAGLGGIGDGATFVVTAVKQAIKGNPVGTADIPIAFNQAAFTTIADITIIVA